MFNYMKNVIAFVCIVGASCDGLMKQNVREFIPGSYVRVIDTEFAVGVDSVVIVEQGAENYTITKYSRYSRLKNGVLGEEEYHKELMAGTYDKEKQVINEFKKGKVLHFNVEEEKMFIGGSEYNKVR